MSIDLSTFNMKLINYLMQLDKYFVDAKYSLPSSGESDNVNLESTNESCDFFLDISRGGPKDPKCKLQTRYKRNNLWIFRLELNASPHVNPDGTITDRDHVHVRLEEGSQIVSYGYNLSSFHQLMIDNKDDFIHVFEAYCKYNNIDLSGTSIQPTL